MQTPKMEGVRIHGGTKTLNLPFTALKLNLVVRVVLTRVRLGSTLVGSGTSVAIGLLFSLTSITSCSVHFRVGSDLLKRRRKHAAAMLTSICSRSKNGRRNRNAHVVPYASVISCPLRNRNVIGLSLHLARNERNK